MRNMRFLLPILIVFSLASVSIAKDKYVSGKIVEMGANKTANSLAKDDQKYAIFIRLDEAPEMTLSLITGNEEHLAATTKVIYDLLVMAFDKGWEVEIRWESEIHTTAQYPKSATILGATIVRKQGGNGHDRATGGDAGRDSEER